ncbi:S-layer homology domain-containing protein [Rossellomorea vietnamensis]|uniref:S-layer homology domain-containing protein n=1 Tax=Rossellomorea vietnamensis TaxID=218284 RepID=A0A5D4K9P1_9BACI|nr:S-layer homology domain-containing protein [Rossellomorea vietnamensis]TYR73430.1 S-layer homology domain-containing protein [Rossellomorea vietnamensis]
MKKIILLLLAIVLSFSYCLQTAAASKFTDLKSYQEEIDYLAELGIVNGYEDGIFKPEAPIKRIEAVQMILREKGITNLSDAPDPGFTDIKTGDYGYEEIAKAAELGWIAGKPASDNSRFFDKWGTLTRGEMAKILVKAYNLSGSNRSIFKDVPQSHWAHSYISTLIHHRITKGYPDNRFLPQQTLSREHFSVFLARQIENDFRNTDIPITFVNGKVYFQGVTLGTSKQEVIKQLGDPYKIEPSEMNPGEVYLYKPSPLYEDILAVLLTPSGNVEFINYRTFTSFPLSIEEQFVRDFHGDIYGESEDVSSENAWLHYYFPEGSKNVFMTESHSERDGSYSNRFKLGQEYQGVPIETDNYFNKLSKQEAIDDYSNH